ncbi:MAG TPA: hypothetical protein VF514_09900 [Bacteroidota bacterium]
MSLPPHSSHPRSAAGLCGRCLHAHEVKSAHGSTFIRCGLSAADPRFPKYPRIPVLACTGFAVPPDVQRRAT